MLTVAAVLLPSATIFAQPWEGNITDIRSHRISKITKILEQGGRRDTEFVYENRLLPDRGIRQVRRAKGDSVIFYYDSLDRFTRLIAPEGRTESVTYRALADRMVVAVDSVTGPTGSSMTVSLKSYDKSGRLVFDSSRLAVHHYPSPLAESWTEFMPGNELARGERYRDEFSRDSFEVVRLYDRVTDSLRGFKETRTLHNPAAHTSERTEAAFDSRGKLIYNQRWETDSTLRRTVRTLKSGRRTDQGIIVWSADRSGEQGEWLDTAWDRHFSADRTRYVWDQSSSSAHLHTEWIYEYDLLK